MKTREFWEGDVLDDFPDIQSGDVVIINRGISYKTYIAVPYEPKTVHYKHVIGGGAEEIHVSKCVDGNCSCAPINCPRVKDVDREPCIICDKPLILLEMPDMEDI